MYALGGVTALACNIWCCSPEYVQKETRNNRRTHINLKTPTHTCVPHPSANIVVRSQHTFTIESYFRKFRSQVLGDTEKPLFMNLRTKPTASLRSHPRTNAVIIIIIIIAGFWKGWDGWSGCSRGWAASHPCTVIFPARLYHHREQNILRDLYYNCGQLECLRRHLSSE